MDDQDSAIVRMYSQEMMSIPMIAVELSIPQSRLRTRLFSCGVKLRTRTEGIRLRRDVLGSGLRGKKRQFSDEWKTNLRASLIRSGEARAAGISYKSNGYVQITRGENKHRSQHVVIMEQHIGRRLLKNECVHHIDGNRSNNNLDNLALLTRAEHSRIHRIEDALAGKNRRRGKNGRFL